MELFHSQFYQNPTSADHNQILTGTKDIADGQEHVIAIKLEGGGG